MEKIFLPLFSNLENVKLKTRHLSIFLTCVLVFYTCVLMAQTNNDAGVIMETPRQRINTPLSACAVTLTGQITDADPSLTYRFFRDATPSSCDAPKSCPGSFSSGTFYYKIVTWTNPSPIAQCVAVTSSNLTELPTPYNFVVAYNGTVDINNICTNYLADPGSSSSPSDTFEWSFTVPGSATVSFFVQSVVSGQATDYSILINPTLCVSCPTSALSASKQDVCPNTEVTLDAHCSDPNATVNWNPGGATVTPDAPNTVYVYKASCTLNGCTGNESSVEVRTHRILVDIKDVGMGTQPKALAGMVKDNLSPTNTFLTSNYAAPRFWTVIANGCSASESAVFKLTGPVSFNNIDNNPPYALFANVGSTYFSIDHPNYGQGAQGFPIGTYNLEIDLRSADGVGGPFPRTA